MYSPKKRQYEEPSIRYADPHYCIDGIRRDSPKLEKARRKLKLQIMTDVHETRIQAIGNLLKDRNRLGDTIDVVSGNMSYTQFEKIHREEIEELDQEIITSKAWHLLKSISADAEEIAVMLNCQLQQAEKAIAEIQRLT